MLAVSWVTAAPVIVSVDEALTRIEGPEADSLTFFGQPLAGGDLNGDRLDEILTAASSDGDGLRDRVFIFRGGSSLDPASPAPTETTISGPPMLELLILAPAEGDLTASSIAIGDVNGDAINDLVLASPGASANGRTDNGVIHVLWGGQDLFDLPVIDLAQPTSWDLRIVGAAGFDDTGGGGPFGGFDAQALAVGNLNGDQYRDIIIGAHFGGPLGSAGPFGQVHVVFGEDFASGTEIDLATTGPTGRDILITGRGDGDHLGEVVAAADLDGDTVDELILPNSFFSQLGILSTEGRVHIFKGRATGWPATINLGSQDADITISGTTGYDQLGSTAAVGDFNGDTITDLAVAAEGDETGSDPDPNASEGLVHVYLGGARFAPASARYEVDADPADLVIVGRPTGSLGVYPIAAGDIDGDGRDDLILPHRDAAMPGMSQQGITDIVLGRPSFGPAQVLRLGDGESDFAIVGNSLDQAGSWAATADTDNSGEAEVLVSSSFRGGGKGAVWIFRLVDGELAPAGLLLR
jgi:hypothetical protein